MAKAKSDGGWIIKNNDDNERTTCCNLPHNVAKFVTDFANVLRYKIGERQ